jgi:hypothetical protein
VLPDFTLTLWRYSIEATSAGVTNNWHNRKTISEIIPDSVE